MKKVFLAGAAALAVLVGCASGPTIRSNIDPAADATEPDIAELDASVTMDD